MISMIKGYKILTLVAIFTLKYLLKSKWTSFSLALMTYKTMNRKKTLENNIQNWFLMLRTKVLIKNL